MTEAREAVNQFEAERKIKKAAKPPLTRDPSRLFLDDATAPPCGGARRGTVFLLRRSFPGQIAPGGYDCPGAFEPGLPDFQLRDPLGEARAR
jgi:hypothetical protein